MPFLPPNQQRQSTEGIIALLLISYLFIYYVCKLQVAGGGGLCLAGLPAGGVSAE